MSVVDSKVCCDNSVLLGIIQSFLNWSCWLSKIYTKRPYFQLKLYLCIQSSHFKFHGLTEMPLNFEKTRKPDYYNHILNLHICKSLASPPRSLLHTYPSYSKPHSFTQYIILMMYLPMVVGGDLQIPRQANYGRYTKTKRTWVI